MKQTDVEIPEPCSASWEEMRGDHQKRFCGDCSKNVHNLSMLTEDDAQALLDQEQYNLCVQYACNTDGDIMFKDTPNPEWRLFAQQKGLKLLLSAATIAVPLLMAGCDNAKNTIEPTVTSPIEIDGNKNIKINTGASRTPPKTVNPDHLIKETAGDIAHEPKIEVRQGEPPVQDKPDDKDKPACDQDAATIKSGEVKKVDTTKTKVKPENFTIRAGGRRHRPDLKKKLVPRKKKPTKKKSK